MDIKKRLTPEEEEARRLNGSPAVTPILAGAPTPSLPGAPAPVGTPPGAVGVGGWPIVDPNKPIPGATPPAASAQPYPKMLPSGPTTESQFGGVYTPETPTGKPSVGPIDAIVNLFKDSAQAAKTGVHYNDVVAAREGTAGAGTATPAAPEGNPLVPQPFAVQSPFGATPDKMTMPGDSPAGKAIVLGPNDGTGGGFTADSGSYNVNQTSQPGVQRVTGAGKSPLYTNINPADAVAGLGNQLVGGDAAAVKEGLDRHAAANKITAEMIANRDKDIPPGGYGAAVLGEKPAGSENADRLRQSMDEGLSKIKSPRKRAEFIKGMESIAAQQESTAMQERRGAAHDATIMRGQNMANAKNPLDDQLKSTEIQAKQAAMAQAGILSGLQNKALNGTPEEQQKARSDLAAITGKTPDYKDRYITLPNRKTYDKFGQVTGEESPGVFDAATGRVVQTQAQGGSMVEKANAIKAEVAAGRMSRDEGLKQLRAMGIQ